MGRRGVVVASLIGLVTLLSSVARAGAATTAEQDVAARINADRTSRGLAPLTWAADVAEYARSWSERMAAAGRVSHDANIEQEVSGWTLLGDNVGRGSSALAVHAAFMQSPGHRDNVLTPEFREVGVGIAQAGNVVYVTEIFVLRGAAAPAATAPRPRVRSAARPAAPAEAPLVLVRTGRIWHLELARESVSVDVLVQLIGLDSPSVDPATGAPR